MTIIFIRETPEVGANSELKRSAQEETQSRPKDLAPSTNYPQGT